MCGSVRRINLIAPEARAFAEVYVTACLHSRAVMYRRLGVAW